MRKGMTQSDSWFTTGSCVMGAVPIGWREAGCGSPAGGLLVTQIEVMRAMDVMMEKSHPKDPEGSLSQRHRKLGESTRFGVHTCCILSLRCSSSIFLFLPFRSVQTPPPQRGCPGLIILSKWMPPFLPISSPCDFLYCNFMICDFVYSFVPMFIVSSVRTVASTVLSAVNPRLWAECLTHNRCF